MTFVSFCLTFSMFLSLLVSVVNRISKIYLFTHLGRCTVCMIGISNKVSLSVSWDVDICTVYNTVKFLGLYVKIATFVDLDSTAAVFEV